jgi:4-aminobutyrate aminotransferase-like enzyme
MAARGEERTMVPPFLGAGDFVYRAGPVPRFVSGSGCRLRDSEGRTYVDAEAANGTLALGYDGELIEGVARTVAELPALPSFCESDLRLRVAERIEREVSRAAGAPGRVAFESGGAQGVELAMKIVAANKGWGPVVTFAGGYHGRSPFTGALSASSRYRSPIPVGAGEVIRLPYPDADRPPFGAANGQTRLDYLDALRSDLSGVPAEVSALIFEPVLNVGGMALPSVDYLEAAATQFRQRGALVVVDEIFTGFHRVGPRFGFQLHGVSPDLVVISKALTNGVSGLSAVWAREPLLDESHFPPGTHSSTFAGTPLTLATADAVLSRFTDQRAWTTRVADLQERLTEIVAAAVAEVPEIVADGTAHGGVARLVLRQPVAWRVRNAALADSPGVLLASTGMAPDVVALHPPLTIGAEDLDIVGTVLLRALRSAA